MPPSHPAAPDEPGAASEDEALRALFSEPQEPAVEGVPTSLAPCGDGSRGAVPRGRRVHRRRSYRQSLSILPSSGGTVQVDSKPVGAQVKIDGQPKGATPLSMQVSAGTHVMELSVGGEPRVMPITVNAGETLGQYIELAGTPATGRLSVSSTPAGAAILIDGQPRGVTPTELPDVAAGDHELMLDLNGARTRQPVTIAAGTLTKVDVKLGPGAQGAAGAAGAVAGAPGASSSPQPCRRSGALR